MFERINIPCFKCGSKEGFIELVSDPLKYSDESFEPDGYLMVDVSCSCSRRTLKWVQNSILEAVLRDVCSADVLVASKIVSILGLKPARWKPYWRLELGRQSVLKRRMEELKDALTILLPDHWTWFNGARLYGVSETQWEDHFPPSRRSLKSWASSVSSQRGVQSLWAALLNAPEAFPVIKEKYSPKISGVVPELDFFKIKDGSFVGPFLSDHEWLPFSKVTH